MNKICFFDLKNNGHHWNYNLNVIKSKVTNNICIYYTANLSNEQSEILSNLGVKIKNINYKEYSSKISILINYIILFKILMFCKKNKVNEFYILYLDNFIIQMNSLKFLFKRKIVGTLHWYPNNKVKEKYLQTLKNKIKIIVHTEEILEKLDNEAKLIYYPNFNEKTKNIFKIHKNNNLLTILYFGALRLDKGVDILLESLKYTKTNYNLIIAGKESSFTKEFIMEKIKDYNKKRFIIDINYISDEKMEEYYNIADIVVLPYRKHFSGESGILIESITKGKVIISTSISNANKIINKYNNGEIFEFEDEKMLASKIDSIIYGFEKYSQKAKWAQEKFQKKHNLNNFIKEYKNI